eukprot:CAMPEP_0115162722 /NCGR_PEP_ID=MMETSP0227-20121206/72115_1 /TAXON_ID=89957 /ORGANISM="Polarella glacialis, Strain CCMP 1383" /LENGTH=146 /DNA_ID=CAMNT_0002574955 /DNA_START=29 /DNA_END=466 /DNA_ORIENTATION=+
MTSAKLWASRGPARLRFSPDEDEEPSVQIEVSSSSGGGQDAKALGRWMRGAGAKAVAHALRGDAVRPAITAAEVAQANPEADRAKRQAEQARAADALKSAASQEQARIAEEQRRREAESRVSQRPEASKELAGSVWNVNAWHWEEK